MTTTTDGVSLTSHPSLAFEGAVHLFTNRDAHLLAVTRTPLKCASRRLREEGYPVGTAIIIHDGAGVASDLKGTVAALARQNPADGGRATPASLLADL